MNGVVLDWRIAVERETESEIGIHLISSHTLEFLEMVEILEPCFWNLCVFWLNLSQLHFRSRIAISGGSRTCCLPFKL